MTEKQTYYVSISGKRVEPEPSINDQLTVTATQGRSVSFSSCSTKFSGMMKKHNFAHQSLINQLIMTKQPISLMRILSRFTKPYMC